MRVRLSVALIILTVLSVAGSAQAGTRTPLTGFPARVANLPFTDSPILPFTMQPTPERFLGFMAAGNPDGNIALYVENYENGEQLWAESTSLEFNGYPVGPLALLSTDPNPGDELAFGIASAYSETPAPASGATPRFATAVGLMFGQVRVYGGRTISSILAAMVGAMFGPLTRPGQPVGADIDRDGRNEGNATRMVGGTAEEAFYFGNFSRDPLTLRPPPGYQEKTLGPASSNSQPLYIVTNSKNPVLIVNTSYDKAAAQLQIITEKYPLDAFDSDEKFEFDLVPGEGYRVKSTADLTYSPSHYSQKAQERNEAGHNLIVTIGDTLVMLNQDNPADDASPYPQPTLADGFPVTLGAQVQDLIMIQTVVGGGVQNAILVTTADGGVYCYSKAGNLLWSRSVSLGTVSDPICADINGDGLPEVLFSSGTEVIVLDAAGNVINGPGGSDPDRYDTGAPLTTSPVVFDLNGDGLLEIAVAGSNTDGGGWFWAWPTSSPTSAPRPWPMAYQNPQRNAVMP